MFVSITNKMVFSASSNKLSNSNLKSNNAQNLQRIIYAEKKMKKKKRIFHFPNYKPVGKAMNHK